MWQNFTWIKDPFKMFQLRVIFQSSENLVNFLYMNFSFFFPNHFKHTSHLIVKLIKWPLLNQFCHDRCVMSWPTLLTKRVVVCPLLYLQNFNTTKFKNQPSIQNKITGLRLDTFSCCWPSLSWKMKPALGSSQHHSQYFFFFNWDSLYARLNSHYEA